MKILFAHGLEGSPNGSKPTWMKESLDWEIICPEMSNNGWTIADQTEVIAKAIAENEDIDIIMGSSYGGLAIANVSERFAEQNLRLVLLAPAFGLAENFRSIAGEQGLTEWENSGSRQYFHHGFGHDIKLGWDFMETAEKMSWPRLNHPTVILHGTEDDIVPIENSRRMTHEDDCVISLIEIEDGHRMQKAKSAFATGAKICLNSQTR